MARINFDSDIESREQFWVLLEKCSGDRDRALGKLVRFFRLCQNAYGKNRPVSKLELQQVGLLDLVDTGWAIEIPGGYQAVGADKQFAWYRQKLEAGKRGGRPRKVRDVFPSKPDDNRPVISGNREEAAQNPLALAPAPALSKEEEEEELPLPPHPNSPIMELKDVVGSELLEDTPHLAQYAWIRVYGLELVKTELPNCFAKWVSDANRSKYSTFAVYFRHWLSNAQKDLAREKTTKVEKTGNNRTLRNTHTPCRAGFHPGNGAVVCTVHMSDQVCELEKRGVP